MKKKIEFPELLPDMFRFCCNEKILEFLVNQLRDDVRIGYSYIIFNNCPRFRKHDIRYATKHMVKTGVWSKVTCFIFLICPRS